MKNRHYFLLFLLSFLFRTAVTQGGELTGKEAQDKINGAEKIITGTYSNIPEYILFRKESQLPYSKFLSWTHTAFSLSSAYGLKLLNTENDDLGMTHYRYQQTYNGFPIVGTMLIVHTKSDMISSMNGVTFNTIQPLTAALLDEQGRLFGRVLTSWVLEEAV